MERITRNVRDLTSDERRAVERVVGHALAENQQVILQIITVDAAAPESEEGTVPPAGDVLPGWTNVYKGLTDDELAEVEGVVLSRSDLTRPSA